jgi:class 3 adenylate cyclase/tetratricopeptide (TPR) repeat protein
MADTPAAENLDGERKTVTFLFADIKGSMDLMEDLDPEEARAIVDPALKVMMEAVHHYGGYVAQPTGDGIFALFGAPIAHEDHPQRALFAALRLQEEMRRYSAKLRLAGNLPVEARVGVNTGEVVVRSIPTGQGNVEYAPIGHSTGLAARMQALAPTGSIAATEQVRKLCEGYFVFKSLGPTKVKGVSEAVNVYEVTGLGPLRTRLQRAAARGYTKFIGRDREMEALRHAADQARAGHGQIVAAVAEPGVGKSRLFYEFKATAQSGWMVLEALSFSHGKASAYLPVLDLLQSYFGIDSEDDSRKRREKVNGRVLTLDRALEDALAHLLGLLGLNEGDDPLAGMDAQIRQRRMLEALKRVLFRESLNQPLMVIFEDLHWIDEETQAFLNLLADAIGTAKILLLVNYRPEYSHTWSSKSYYTQLRLDPLGKESAGEMLDALLGLDAQTIDGQLAGLKRLIIEKTEGNPLFMEEIVQALTEEGVLVRNGAVKLTRPLAALKVPPTVQDIIASRIDRLPAAEKDLLQTLAVIGMEFTLALAGEVTKKPNDQLNRLLNDLQLAEFIYEQPAAGDTAYIFKHALTHDVAYKSLLVEQRKRLHERIGQATERLFADHLDDYLKDLAHHYRRSNNSVKAIEYLQRAGEQAALRAFHEEAIEQLHSALELLEKLDAGKARNSHELAIRRALMGPLIAVRSLISPEIRLNCERLRELCEEARDTRLLAQVLIHLFWYYFSATSLDEAETFARQGLKLAEQTSGEFEIFCGNFSSGVLAAERGEYLAARQHLERSVSVNQHTQDLIIGDPGIALGFPNCIGLLGIVCWILGYPDQAQAQGARLAELLRQSLPTNAYTLGMSHLLTMRCDLLRNYQGARADAQEALDRSTRSGHSLGIDYGAVRLARIMVAEGTTDPWIEKLAGELRAVPTSWHQHLCDWLAAGACLEARRIAEGCGIVDQAIARMAAGGARRFEADLHRLKGEFTLMARGDLGDAEAAFNSAIAIARRQQARGFELRASISLARVLAQQGRRDEACAMLADIYNWFTEGFDTADLKDAKALLDELDT